MNVVEAAKVIRKSLKSNFSETKFAVRSHKYAGGSHIEIVWTDGPTAEKVRKMVKDYMSVVSLNRRYSVKFLEDISKKVINQLYGKENGIIVSVVGSDYGAFLEGEALQMYQDGNFDLRWHIMNYAKNKSAN